MMRQILLTVLVCAVGGGGVAEATTAQLDFAGDAEQYVEQVRDGVDVVTLDDGGSALRLDAEVSRIDLKPMAVESDQKYKLSFDARVAGDFVVERNDRAHIKTVHSFRGRLASNYELTFLDQDGEPIQGFGYGASGFFLTQQWHNYVSVFHTPPGAASLRVRIQPRSTVYLRGVTLSPENDEATINANPDFRYGDLNYAGWNPQRDGRLHERPDGKVVFRPGYGGSSPLFPMSEGEAYRITARGQGGRINLTYFGRDGDRIHSRFLLRPSDEEQAVEATPPEGAHWGQFVMYGVTAIEEVRVTRVE